MKLQVGDRIQTEDNFEFTCPFCGRGVTYGQVESHSLIAHDIPMCSTYRRLSADDYLKVCLSEFCKHEPN